MQNKDREKPWYLQYLGLWIFSCSTFCIFHIFLDYFYTRKHKIHFLKKFSIFCKQAKQDCPSTNEVKTWKKHVPVIYQLMTFHFRNDPLKDRYGL